MLQQETPEDFVVDTCKQYSVREFVNAAARELGMQICWEGQGMEGKGYLTSPSPLTGEGERIIDQVDLRYFRPTEVKTLLGDAKPGREKIRLAAKSVFDALVCEDLKAAERDQLIQRQGYRVMDRHE